MKPTSPTERPALLTLGAARVQLAKLGYRPVSALTLPPKPAEFPAPAHPELFYRQPDALQSEHPAAVLCAGGAPALALLLLAPIADAALAGRVRELLEKAGLLSGPVRVGSDAIETRPLRLGGPLRNTHMAALDGAVSLWTHRILPLDGSWRPERGLLAVSAASLPEIKTTVAMELFEAIGFLPTRIEAEREPPPKASKYGWIGR